MANDLQTKDDGRPKFHVTRRGELYIKGSELLSSKAGREAIREAATAMGNWTKKVESPSSEE